MKYKTILFFYFVLASVSSFSDPSIVHLQKKRYVETYVNIAVIQMWEFGIPASITLAQAILESKTGCSPLAKYANNHFGIKCKKEWEGAQYFMNDDKPNECFRKYESVEESFEDHSKFLKYRPYYQSLFKLDKKDYKGWALGLKKAGYATNPAYAKLLIDIIEELELMEFDQSEFTYFPLINSKLFDIKLDSSFINKSYNYNVSHDKLNLINFENTDYILDHYPFIFDYQLNTYCIIFNQNKQRKSIFIEIPE